MLELQTEIGPLSSNERFAPPAADRTRRFLVDSERRVILRCKKLLDDQDLTAEDRRRLTRIVNEAEARFQGLGS
jgi:hypothetical protein